MNIVVGLGNPGDNFRYTKHNIGFMAVDYFASKHGININKIKHKAVIGEGIIGREKIILAKPQTYMNCSGESVLELVEWYKLETANLILIYDDIDLPVGKIRIRPGGGPGTHNGMRSIIHLLKSQDFPRIRIGIGKQPDYMDLGDFVMGKFRDDEIPVMKEALEKVAMTIEEISKNGINLAMNKYNK